MSQNPYEKLVSELKQEEREQSRRRRKSGSLFGRVCAFAARVLLLVFIAFVALGYCAYQSAQKLPEFYASALATPSKDLAESGQVFEQRALDLQNAAQQDGKWETVFTDDQINGWIAVDLPRKFPQWLPPEVTNPRVSFAPDEIQFACRYDTQRLGGIVVAKGNAFCTSNPNEIAIRVYSVSAGILPIPISQLADAITTGLRQASVPAEWTEMEGDPVALITLPRKVTDVGDEHRVILEQVVVEQNRLVLRGRTEPLD